MITYGVCVVPQLKTKQNKKRDEGEAKNIALGGRKVCLYLIRDAASYKLGCCVCAPS